MSKLYENLRKATNNIDDITTERYATVTKLNGNYCDVKEEDTGLEHTNVPIVNGANLSVGDKAIIGFINNSIYDAVCYGALDKTIHDDSKQDTLISGTNIKTINNTSLLGSGNINIQGGGTVTSLRVSDYNPNIDSTVTLTVTVKDVYNRPVENESVQVTCNIGKFTKLNGSTISDTQSVTAQTDSNGEFTLTYACSEWGLVTFSANTSQIQVKVTGFKLVESYQSNKVIVYRDESNMLINVRGSFSSLSNPITLATTTLKPKSNQIVFAHEGISSSYKVAVNSNGDVKVIGATGTQSIYTSVYLPIA